MAFSSASVSVPALSSVSEPCSARSGKRWYRKPGSRKGKFLAPYGSPHRSSRQKKRANCAHTFRVLEPANPTKLDEPEHVVLEAAFVFPDGLVRVVRRVGRADIDGGPV